MGVKYPPGHGAHGLHVSQIKWVMVILRSSGAMSAPIVITMSLLSGGWLASKCRVTAVVRLVMVWVIICKVDAASVRIGIVVKFTFHTIHLGLHLRESGAVGIGVRWCLATRCLFLLAFLAQV